MCRSTKIGIVLNLLRVMLRKPNHLLSEKFLLAKKSRSQRAWLSAMSHKHKPLKTKQIRSTRLSTTKLYTWIIKNSIPQTLTRWKRSASKTNKTSRRATISTHLTQENKSDSLNNSTQLKSNHLRNKLKNWESKLPNLNMTKTY